MNIYLKIGGVVWFVYTTGIIFFLVLFGYFFATTQNAYADRDPLSDSFCQEYRDGIYACFPFTTNPDPNKITFQGSGGFFNAIQISDVAEENDFLFLWDVDHCQNDAFDENDVVLCTIGNYPDELLQPGIQLIAIDGVRIVDDIQAVKEKRELPPYAGLRIGTIKKNTVRITFPRSNFNDADKNILYNINNQRKTQWEILFGITQEPVIETLSVDEFCGAVEEKYKAYNPEGIPLTSSQTLTLQVSGYPTFGVGNGGTSLNTIVADSFSLSSVIAYLYRSSLVIAGIVAFLSLLYGGILFILSGDSPDKRKQAVSRVQKVFFGAFILLTAVLTFEFIGLDINATRNLELEIETPEGGLELPNDRNAILIRNTENHDYYGIPFTNRAGASRVYGDLITKVPSECLGCRHNTGHTKEMACHFACDSTALLRDKAYTIGEFTGYDRLKNYLYAVRECTNERDKSVYKDVGDTIQYALVRDDDDTPVSCAAACIKLAGDSGAKCDSAINQDQNKKFKKWKDEKLDGYRAIPIKETLYPNFFLFERKNSLNDSYLQDKSDKDRSGLRECIGENYIIDAQQFPTIESRDNSTDICVCKK